MIYLTGDTHGSFGRFAGFCEKHGTTTEDIMIILGDAGINFFGGWKDHKTKKKAAKYPITFFCVHGNHERRPWTVPGMKEKEFCGGRVWYDEEFPNQLFAHDGDVYQFGGKDCIVIGGAYSVDKYERLARGWPWFPNEQPSTAIKAEVEAALAKRGKRVDAVLSHTCPRIFEPREVFTGEYDESTIDKSTEDWLAMVESDLSYDRWYCGHFHIEKSVEKLRFLYEDIIELGQ